MNTQDSPTAQSVLETYRTSLFSLPHVDAGAEGLSPGEMLEVASEQLGAMVVETNALHVLGHHIAVLEENDQSPSAALATVLAMAMQSFETRVIALLDLVHAARQRMPTPAPG